MLQVLFALNWQYWLNEKGAVALADTFALRPARLRPRVEECFGLLAADGHSIRAAIDGLEEIKADIERLTAAHQVARQAGVV
jgi:hypothetical protein